MRVKFIQRPWERKKQQMISDIIFFERNYAAIFPRCQVVAMPVATRAAVGCCQSVARLWLLLGCCEWLPGCCYALTAVRLMIHGANFEQCFWATRWDTGPTIDLNCPDINLIPIHNGKVPKPTLLKNVALCIISLRLLWVVAKVLLGCGWLPGCCCVVSVVRLLWVVARVLLCCGYC